MGRETYTGDVAFEVRGHLGLITLNRPKALNSLTGLMCEAITVQLQEWAQDGDVAQVLVRGAGERGLCAGGDVIGFHRDMVAHQPEDGGPLLPEGAPAYAGSFETEQMLAAEYAMNRTIAAYPKPYIALMDGVVLGGGVGVSAHGSHRVVTERSRVGMPETGIGFSPDVGATYLLSRVPGKLGLHIALTGLHLSAADAIHTGLADLQVRSEELEQLTSQLTSAPADQVLPAFRMTPAPSALAEAAAWIDEAYAAPTVEEVLERLEELGHEHPEAAQAAETIGAKSPLMTKVAFRAVTGAAELSLEGALSQEYTIAVHALRSHDFREGIRAQVLDKDREPQWRPATLPVVGEGLVDHYFTPVPGKLLALP